jgi:hypothetical protein
MESCINVNNRFDTPIKRRAYEMRAEKNEKFNMHELSDVMNVNNEILEQEAAHQANFLVNTKPVYSDTRVSFGEAVVRITRNNFEFSMLDLSLTFISANERR